MDNGRVSSGGGEGNSCRFGGGFRRRSGRHGWRQVLKNLATMATRSGCVASVCATVQFVRRLTISGHALATAYVKAATTGVSAEPELQSAERRNGRGPSKRNNNIEFPSISI
jgi:negative regulator of sigma E activity